MNRSFPLKLPPDIPSAESYRFGHQRLVKKTKPSELKQRVLHGRPEQDLPLSPSVMDSPESVKASYAEIALKAVRAAKRSEAKKKRAALNEGRALPVPIPLTPLLPQPSSPIFKILANLATFQRRAKEEAPLKAAKSKRLVIGLRECERALACSSPICQICNSGTFSKLVHCCPEKPQKLIGLVLANNIVDQPVLDEMRRVLIKAGVPESQMDKAVCMCEKSGETRNEAKSLSETVLTTRGVVVVLGAISRNQIGKALGLSVRQTAVGVVSVQGVHKEWKDLVGEC